MLKKTKIGVFDVFKYLLVTLASNAVACYISLWAADGLKPVVKAMGLNSMYTLSLLTIPVCMGLALAEIYFYLKRKVITFYRHDEDKYFGVKNALYYILPAEVVRFVICAVSVGDIMKTGIVGMPPTLIYEVIYMASGKYNIIQNDAHSFGDVLAFVGIYLVYMCIHTGIVLRIFEKFWKKEAKEIEEMHNHLLS